MILRLIDETRWLKQQVEQSIGTMFAGRIVHIMGGLNIILIRHMLNNWVKRVSGFHRNLNKINSNRAQGQTCQL